MEDREMFETMAKLWIALGGDALGFKYCCSSIEDQIKELERKKEE